MPRRSPTAFAACFAACFAAVTLLAACAGNELHLPSTAPTTAPRSTTTPTTTGPSSTTTGPGTSSTTPGAGGPTFTPGPVEWSPCKASASFQCATLQVPLDYLDPTGTKIDLALGRQQASGRKQGALLTNPGGPGASGLSFLFNNPFSAKVASEFDIVSWDPRGVGASTHLRCGSKVDEFLTNDPDPDDDAEQQRIDAAAKAVADECGATDRDLLNHMGTDDVARDMETIRVALGGQPLNYVGFSYGTYIGLRYAALFPTNIRAMVLDGVLDPTQRFTDWLAGQATAIDGALRRAFESCDRRATCPVNDLGATYDQVRASVEKSPLPTDSGRRLGPAELATAAIYTSYDPDLWPQLATAIVAAREGDGTAMMDLAQGYYDFGGFTAYAAVECIDTEHPLGSVEYQAFAKRLEQISPRFGGGVANELLPCAYWPVPAQDHSGPITAPGSPPILVLGNRGDAATPYQNSVRVASDLVQGHLVSYAGEGHTSYGRNSCVTDVTDAYLLQLRVPAKDPDCK